MKFVKKNEIPETKADEILNYSSVEDTEPQSNPVIEKQASKFQFRKSVAKPEESKAKSVVKEEKEEEMLAARADNTENHAVKMPPTNSTGSEWAMTQKIIDKFVNKSAKAAFGSAIEFSKAPFNLCKKDGNNYRISLDGKLLMNLWTFDKKTNKQISLIPTYIDISEWLNICHMITSGRIFDLTEEAKAKQNAGGYKYCGFIYQNNGGSYKPIYKLNGKQFGGQKGQPIATIFKITPSNTPNSWVLSSEIFDGITGDTGLIEEKKGNKPYIKIQVLLNYDSLISIAEMSKMAIQAHFIKMN